MDDDADQRDTVAAMVSDIGYTAITAQDGEEALDRIEEGPIHAIVTDLMMPRMDGFQLLETLRSRGDQTPAIVLTGFGSSAKAISIVHDLHAFWFQEKPVDYDMLAALLERAVSHKGLVDETARLQRQLSYQGILGDLVGTSAPMRKIYAMIQQAAPSSASVFITGESGTGKELVARAIHRASPRMARPFVAINCAALPETLIESELFGHEKGAFTGAVERRAGCFEQAHEGTILLDEIGDMPMGTQAKLLRVLEEGKVRRLGGKGEISINVRVLAATNKTLKDALAKKSLREDLFYRLNVFHLALPPLRQRKEDIPLIAEAMIRDLNKKNECRVADLQPAVIECFMNYGWPGNVRELRNVIERAVIVAGEGTIRMQHLPPLFETKALPQSVTPETDNPTGLNIRPGATLREVEEAYIRQVLKQTNSDKKKTAEVLGISLRTVHTRIAEFQADDKAEADSEFSENVGAT